LIPNLNSCMKHLKFQLLINVPNHNSKYEIVLRLKNMGKHFMRSETAPDLSAAFNKADEMLNAQDDCFAEIVEANTNEVVATLN
jgi:hypothetical protein